MKKTLAESIRSTLDTLSEGNMEYALSDLHKESNGEPTAELADEIAAEYGLKGPQLLAAYPKYADTLKNQTPLQTPVDPKKARMKADHDSRVAYRKYEADLEAKREEQKQQAAQKRKDHVGIIHQIESEMEDIEAPEGWHKSIKSPDHETWQTVGDIVFLNAEGNVKIVMHFTVSDTDAFRGKAGPSTHHYNVAGDTLYKFKDKWYTFTDYSKWGDSFSIGEYSDVTTLDQIPELLQREEARAKASLEKKTARGY